MAKVNFCQGESCFHIEYDIPVVFFLSMIWQLHTLDDPIGYYCSSSDKRYFWLHWMHNDCIVIYCSIFITQRSQNIFLWYLTKANRWWISLLHVNSPDSYIFGPIFVSYHLNVQSIATVSIIKKICLVCFKGGMQGLQNMMKQFQAGGGKGMPGGMGGMFG